MSGRFSKTRSVGFRGIPHSWKACFEMGIYSTPFVFCWVKLSRVWLPIVCISFHCIFWMSQWRKPVRAENRAARFNISLSHGVATNWFSSSVVRYSRRVCNSGIPFILADKSPH